MVNHLVEHAAGRPCPHVALGPRRSRLRLPRPRRRAVSSPSLPQRQRPHTCPPDAKFLNALTHVALTVEGHVWRMTALRYRSAPETKAIRSESAASFAADSVARR